MLDEFRQRLGDRRGKYSVRKHIGRLRREGRLRQVGVAAVVVLTAGGVAFARCQGSSITGPSEPIAETPRLNLGSETFQENTVERNVVFSGVNPCNGDAVKAFGKRHDKLRVRIAPSGTSATLDHHINDSFHGEAIANPNQKYTGSDVHSDRFDIGMDGMRHREITNEHLIAQGPAPNWILHVHQRSDFRFADPLNPTVTFEGHASCPSESKCTVDGGCVDRDLTVVSVTP
jgi:hypothetical protein